MSLTADIKHVVMSIRGHIKGIRANAQWIYMFKCGTDEHLEVFHLMSGCVLKELKLLADTEPKPCVFSPFTICISVYIVVRVGVGGRASYRAFAVYTHYCCIC